MDLCRWATGIRIRNRRPDHPKRINGLAYDSKASYMILSLMEREQPVLNSFKIEGNNAEKETLIIEE